MDYQSGTIPIIGQVWVELDQHGAWTRVMLPGLDPRQPVAPQGATPMTPRTERAFCNYVSGDRDAFLNVPLAQAPTFFAAAVRQAMCRVPWGAVASYGELARMIGNPGAARAVGRACATNPLPIVVPCHRVVASAGPGGFGLGPGAKRTLLSIEGLDLDAACRQRRISRVSATQP